MGEFDRRSRREALRMRANPSWYDDGIGDERAEERDMDDKEGL